MRSMHFYTVHCIKKLDKFSLKKKKKVYNVNFVQKKKKKKGTEKLCFILSNSDDYMQSLSRRNLLYKYSDDIYVQCFKSL